MIFNAYPSGEISIELWDFQGWQGNPDIEDRDCYYPHRDCQWELTVAPAYGNFFTGLEGGNNYNRYGPLAYVGYIIKNYTHTVKYNFYVVVRQALQN